MGISTRSLAVWLRNGRSIFTGPLALLIANFAPAKMIASYPRSGSTWLRTMLVNVICPEAKSNPDIFNRVIPGATLSNLLKVYASPTPRIFSTHSPYIHIVKKRVVYVLRDGRHSVLSLFRYTTTRVGLNVEYDQWFSDYSKGFYGPRWDEQVASWLVTGQKALAENMLIVRYENLRNDTLSELQKVCEFLNVNYTQDLLIKAVEESSITKMKEWERKIIGDVRSENASFYRGGQANEWVNLLTDEQRERFMSLNKDALQLAGYEYHAPQKDKANL